MIKRLTNLFLLRGRPLNLRLWFREVFLSFLWWLLCCVIVDIPIFSSFFFSPILVLFFSIHFGVFIFFRLIRSLSEMKKKFLMVLQGIKVWSLSGLSSGSSLKFALSRLINFLIFRNNTNSQSSSKRTYPHGVVFKFKTNMWCMNFISFPCLMHDAWSTVKNTPQVEILLRSWKIL